ncbi:hypothetical protein FACS1894133_2760 [Clostridia bacterium]|nr:hypothetical protein FACS1894133_2760 [Clostridia bacterium]
MRVLIAGGTGTISTYVTRELVARGDEVVLLNRSGQGGVFADTAGVTFAACDIHNEEQVNAALRDLPNGASRQAKFDCVIDFIAYTEEDVLRDCRLFGGLTRQYIFISSASAYQKPHRSYTVTESTPLHNPYWRYSQEKIACELALNAKYRDDGFPVTIVRPSHTYAEKSIPTALHGDNGSYEVIYRIKHGLPVPVPGDGLTLWTVTHSSDFAKAFVGLVGNMNAVGEAFQITSDEALTWNQIYGEIASAIGGKFMPTYASSQYLAAFGAKFGYDKDEVLGGLLGDKSNCAVFDNSKIKRFVPGFVATTPFRAGVRAAVAYIESHPEAQKRDEVFARYCDELAVSL